MQPRISARPKKAGQTRKAGAQDAAGVIENPTRSEGFSVIKNAGLAVDAGAAQPFLHDESSIRSMQVDQPIDTLDEDLLVDVLARLRRSKNEFLMDMYEQGKSGGKAWATNEAEEIELRQLARSVNRIYGRCQYEDHVIYSTAEYFAFVIRPGIFGDRMEAADFWAIITGKREVPATNYVRGFALGAMGIWDEVKDNI